MLEHLGAHDGAMTVTDMEAGIEHLKRGTLEHTDTLLIVIEPYYKALEAAGRVFELARNLGVPTIYGIANKVQSPRDEAAIRDYCAGKNLPIVAVVPFDPDVAEAERRGRAPLDLAPESTAMRALRDLATRLLSGSPSAIAEVAAG